MERLKPFFPGLGEKCGDCRKQLESPSKSSFCKAAWVQGGYVLQPKIEEAADGSIVCDSFGPKLSVLIKNLVNRISVSAISRGIQLPQ